MGWKLGDKIIKEGQAFDSADGSVRHPSCWSTHWSDEVKKANGLTYVNTDYDDRFYTGVKDDGSLIKKDISSIKAVATATIKAQAQEILRSTDWYVIRKSETNQEVPDTVANYRTAVRTASKTIEDAITAANTHAKVMALYDIPDGGTVAPITDWREKI